MTSTYPTCPICKKQYGMSRFTICMDCAERMGISKVTFQDLVGTIKSLLDEKRPVTEPMVQAWNDLCQLGLADKCDVHYCYYWYDSNCPKCDMKRDCRKKK